jgi:hypothetical protein
MPFLREDPHRPNARSSLVDRRGAVDPNCSEMHDAVRNR